MKLTLEQIKSVTFGALRIYEDEQGIRFQKCTESQVAAWYQRSQGLGQRSETTTGIRLDFCTDSRTLSVDAASGDKYEVHINNLPRYRVHRAEGEPMVFALGEGEKRVTLILPSHGVGVLRAVELDDGATLAPYAHKRRILFIGDSITQGWNARYDSLSYAWQVTKFLDADSVIQGIGGAYFHESTADTLNFDPDTVVVAYGTNDYGHYKTLEELRTHADLFFAAVAAQYGDKKKLAVTPIFREDMATDKAMGSFAQCRAAVAEMAEKHGFAVVDGLTLVPHHMDFMADSLHPNDLGFGVFAMNLIPYLT